MSAALTRVSALVGELERTVEAFGNVRLDASTQAARANSLDAYRRELELGIRKLRPALTDAAQAELLVDVADDLEGLRRAVTVDELIAADPGPEQWLDKRAAGGLP